MNQEKKHIFILSEILVLSGVTTAVVGLGVILVANTFHFSGRFLPYYSNGFVFFVLAIFQVFLMRLFGRKYTHVDPKLVFLFVLLPFFLLSTVAVLSAKILL